MQKVFDERAEADNCIENLINLHTQLRHTREWKNIADSFQAALLSADKLYTAAVRRQKEKNLK